MTTEEETLIKSAVNDLNTALQAINMTFISQLGGDVVKKDRTQDPGSGEPVVDYAYGPGRSD